MGGSRFHLEKNIWKIFPKLSYSSTGVLLFRGSIPSVFCLYVRASCQCQRLVTKKKVWIGGWVGGVSSIYFFLGFVDFFAKPLKGSSHKFGTS